MDSNNMTQSEVLQTDSNEHQDTAIPSAACDDGVKREPSTHKGYQNDWLTQSTSRENTEELSEFCQKSWKSPLLKTANTTEEFIEEKPVRDSLYGLSKDIHQWSVQDVCSWLKSVGFDKQCHLIIENFCGHKISGEVLLALTETDMKNELGITTLGDRKRLMLAIKRLSLHMGEALSSVSSSPLHNSSPSSSSQQHSPVTHHHHYYQSSPSGIVSPHPHQHIATETPSCVTTAAATPARYSPGVDAPDSGIGESVNKTQRCCCCHHPDAATPHYLAHTLLHKHKKASLSRRSRTKHYYSSDSDDDDTDLNGTAAEDNTDAEAPDLLSSNVAVPPTTAGLSAQPGKSTTTGTSTARQSVSSASGHKRRHTHSSGGGRVATPKLQPEYLKTAISCFYMFLVTWITAIVMVFVHDRVPDKDRHPPLPDIFLDNVPHIPWAFQLCEVTIITLTCTLALILCFHKHRCIILRRFAALSGTVFLLRCATMFITSLSVPGNHLQCSPRERRSVWRQVEQAWLIWQGGGLSIKGVRTCGDYMFSGHTTALTMLNFFITEYTPRRMYYIHICSWVLNMFGVFFVLAAHEHYSIDVFIAFYITSRMFLYYHSLANNRALHQRDSFRTKIWFPMFSYFESNIHGIVPNEYSNLFAFSNLKWAFSTLVTPLYLFISKTKVVLVALSGAAGRHDLLFIRANTPTTDGGCTEDSSGASSSTNSSCPPPPPPTFLASAAVMEEQREEDSYDSVTGAVRRRTTIVTADVSNEGAAACLDS